MDIQYTGEQLIWGKIGHLLVMISFVASLMSVFSYYTYFKTQDLSWRKLSRKLFAIHTGGIIGIFTVLFFIIVNHRFEYYYVWEHSNTKMPLRYILSCFWEGQEGSFLLWMFWHCVLSWIVIFTAKKWEGGVMFVISMVQVFLASMIIGVVIFNYKIGTNPFILLREHPDFASLPFIKLPDYLSKINDGRGLNPLLQNYWMTIHPPTLFLGFALTVVPFAFAIASLMNRKLTEWIKPALIWAVVGIMILGTGILMGAAWAYESLSFGGFWAWDPVENASLVPWMTLVGAVHVMMIYNHRQKALLSAYVLCILSFIFILYSTFLTRSGILGDSSVHAFTDLGMTGQLVIYMLFFLALAIFLMAKNGQLLFAGEVFKGPFNSLNDIKKRTGSEINVYKNDGTRLKGELSVVYDTYIELTQELTTMELNKKVISKKTTTVPLTDIKEISILDDDHFTSREFWMFIGMLILVIGALQITFTTSTPVINKLLGTKLAPPADAIDHYNKWQVPVAILICLVMGVGQFFRWKKSDGKTFWNKITFSIIAAVVITGLCGIILKTYPPHYYLLLFASVFAAVANFDYLFRSLKGKMANAGPSIAHVGIALILCGALISNSKKEVISRNVKNLDLGKDMPNKENIMIEHSIDTLPMGKYFVTYTGYEKKGVNVYYNISYFKPDEKTGQLKKEFDLKPFIQLNDRMGNVAEPATKHFLTKDIYTHITYAAIDDKPADGSDYLPAKSHELAIGDTFMTSNSFVIFRELNRSIDRSTLQLGDSDLVVGASLLVQDINKQLYNAEPLFIIKDFQINAREAFVNELGLKFHFHKVDPATGKITIDVSEKKSNRKDFIIMKAIIFPGINILWVGCLLMITGSLIAIRKRIKKFRAESQT